jgi:hypothetical protein
MRAVASQLKRLEKAGEDPDVSKKTCNGTNLLSQTDLANPQPSH